MFILFRNFVFTNEETVTSDGVQYKPVKQSFYKCSDKPHTGEGICPCIHCDGSCAPGETKIIKKQMPKFRGKKTKRATDSREMEGFKIYFDDIINQFSDYETYAENEYCILDTTCKYCIYSINYFRISLGLIY